MSTTVGWIAMKFCTAVRDPQKMNNNFGDAPDFHSVLSLGHDFKLSSVLVKGKLLHFSCGGPVSAAGKCGQLKQEIPKRVLF